MDAVLLLTVVTLLCLALLGKYISNTNTTRDNQTKKYNEFIYNEARRASRISLQCILELENIAVNNKKQYSELYSRQTEILTLMKNLSGDIDEYDLSGERLTEKSTKEILERIRLRQKYITEVMEKLEKRI